METKGVKINERVTIVKMGSSIVGCLAWETPYVELLTATHGICRWQSDALNKHNFNKGNSIHISAFAYWNDNYHRYHLRRVKISDGGNQS